MPMNMGIHRKPIGDDHSNFLDSRIRGNDGGIQSAIAIRPQMLYCPRSGQHSIWGFGFNWAEVLSTLPTHNFRSSLMEISSTPSGVVSRLVEKRNRKR